MIAGVETPAALPIRSFSPAFRGELNDLFAWRRDVRRFLPDPVSPADLQHILSAVGSAPSVGLSEPWRVVNVESQRARASIIANFEQANKAALMKQDASRRETYAALKLSGLREAPVHFAVFCDEETEQGYGLGAASMPEMRRYSVVCAVMQMWLAARAVGLGMGWVSILNPDRVAKDLDTPPAWTLIAYLCIGWPKENHLDCELERAGWEDRRRLENRIITR